jgi:PAS domain S-box-containing protein
MKVNMAEGPCKVLVVEDEGLIAQDIVERLEALGHTVVATCSNAADAVAQAAAADVVLMDIRIEGPRDGIAAAEEIRARHHVPVVFLTAHADRVTLERAKAAHPYGFLTKPAAPASLHAALEMAVHRHRAERQLEEQEAWYRTALASIAEAVFVTDTLGRIRALNRAAESFAGWSNEDACGQRLDSVVRLVDEENGKEFGDPVNLAVLRGSPVVLNHGLRLVARAARELSVEGAAAPVLSPAGVLLGVVVTLRDVGARRWEERQLRQSERLEAAGKLAAQISNEYAALVQIIRSRTGQLAQQFGEYSPAQAALREIREAAMAAEQVTENLAGLGARRAVQPEIVSLNAILRGMSRVIETIAGQRVAAAIHPGPDTGRIQADPAQIEQAILNLSQHACAVLPDGGRLLIQTSRAETPHQGAVASFACVSFDYTAPEADLEHIFDPSSAMQNAWGLSLAHAIAIEHGGYLTACATPAGTRMEFLLPRVTETLPSPAVPDARQAYTILLVDARERVREQLHNFFESAGYNLLEASGREEAAALAEVHEGALDLLIADAADATPLLETLQLCHPGLLSLAMVDLPESSPREIRRPFTQQTLLERVGQVFSLRADS